MYSSLLFSAASLSEPSSALLTSDWEHSALFASLALQMKKDDYTWDTFVALKAIFLKGPSTAASSAPSRPNNARAAADDEDEDEEDEDDSRKSTITATTASSSSSTSLHETSLDDPLLLPIKPDPSDPLTALSPAQSRAFRTLAAVIRENLSYLPSSPPQPQSSPPVDASDSSPAPAAAPQPPPIARPRDGDVVGLFLVALLLSSPSRPFAQSTLLLLEQLGHLANLKVTIRRLLELIRRPLSVQPPPNLSHTPMDGLDLSASSKAAFVTGHLTPSSFVPVMLQATAESVEVVQRFDLRPLILRLLQSALTDSLAVTSPLTSLTPEPAVWYQFTDTPVFPKVSRLSLPSGAAQAGGSGGGGGASPSIHTHGYTWHAFVSLTGVRDAPNNVFRFFNDTGFGLQVAVKGNALCVRTLPNTSEAVVLKGSELDEGRWVHVAVSHKPLPKVVQTAAAAQQVRRAGGPGGSASPSPYGPHTGVFVAAAQSPSSSPYTALTSPMSGAPGISPTALSQNVRPGKLTLFIDGQPVSVTDVPYPNLESSDNLQCTLGGLYGRMSSFFLFADVLQPPIVAALYALGAAHYAIPAMHVVNAGLVAVFPPPPFATSAVVPPPPPPPGYTGPVAATSSRTVARCLLAQSPMQTTHSVCLPYTWPDDAPSTVHSPLTVPTTAASINQCLHHTLRLDGITVVYRTQNAQTLAVLGGLKLLILCTSPTYYAEPFASDDDVVELLLLLASLVLTSESHAHLLLEIGAASLKALYLDHVKRKHQTVRLLAAIRRFLLAIHLVDGTADGYHFASFTSAFVLDWALWGKASMDVQAAVVRLARLLYSSVPGPFLAFASLGVPRLMDNLLVLNSRYITPPNAGGGSQAPSTLSSPTHAFEAALHQRVASANLSPAPGEFESPALTVTIHPVPSAEETAINGRVVELILTIARASVGSATFERDVVAPFLHLVQACQASHAASVEALLSLLLRALLTVISLSSQRALQYLFRQQAHYVFLRLLYNDAGGIRTLGLRLLAHLNVFCIAAEKAERDKKTQLEYNQLQADVAQAIVSALSLFPVDAAEHDCLWAILMGQTPALKDEEAEGAAAGGPLEAGVAFCHPAFLSMILELSLLSPLVLQSKVLVDVLMLLRTNPTNVDGLAALFWQRLLLPFSSRMHHNPALAQYSVTQLSTPTHALSAPASPTSSSPPRSPSPAAAAEPAVTPHTVDQLVHQVMNLMLLGCLVNEPKGWQVLDQSIWCLQEKNSLLANMPPQVQALTGAVTLARTVHDTWLLEMSVFYRLFHSLHRHVALLSGRRPDSVAAYSETQIGNLRRNMMAVFELTEWILFHSPCSFLTAPTQLALGVPDVDKLPVATRADNHMDDATRDEAIREMLNANASAEAAASSDELPGGAPVTPPDDEAKEENGDASGEASLEPQPAGDIARLSSSSSPPLPSHTSSLTASSLLKTDSLPSSATILRASQRSTDEPLTAEEVEIFTLLLSGVVEQFPMPDKRQDVLRVTFRYLMVVLPHPLCAPLTEHICAMVRLLFLDRVTERVEKNTRLVALTLSLLKTGMEGAIRRQDLANVDVIKGCIGALYHAWGEVVFLENFAPQPHATQWAAPLGLATGPHTGRPSPPPPAQQQPVQPASGFQSTTALPSASSVAPIAEASSDAAAAGDAPPAAPTDPIDEATEAALFRLYQGDGRAVMASTQTVFLQHQQRFAYLSEVRAAKVHASIVDYLRRKRANEALREKKFSLGSTVVLRQSQAAKAFLLNHYALKKGRPQYRLQEREEKQIVRVNRAIKQFRGQVMNSRPVPLPLPPPHPDVLRSHLQSIKDALNGSAPAAAYAYSTAPSLRLLSSHSRLLEFWKLDSTESPTRMRRLLKKNFTSGNPHTFASANASANAHKQMQKAEEAIDLTKIRLTASTDAGDSAQGGVDVNADVDAEKERESAKAAETEKAKLLAAAEADEDDGGDDDDESGESREQDAEEDEVDDDVEDGAAGPRVKRSSKVILAHFATMITPTHKFIGLMRITTTSLTFSGLEHVTLAGAETAASTTPQLKTDEVDGGLDGGRRRKAKVREKHIRWSLKQLRMVLPRYFLLRESALEMFLNNFKNYFFNFTPLADDVLAPLLAQPAYAAVHSSLSLSRAAKKWKSGREQRNEVYKLLCTLVPDMQFELSPGRRLLKSGIMKAWQRGEVSNFDYLMHLNTIAGRSYNDINQYPVFPWVLTDYRSAELDLDDPAVYRDLSKPIGALNEDRFEIFQERFQGFEDETIPPFLYGSHYSSAGIALHYLIRCEPFTSLAISLQGGRFDLPDRLFDSIAGSWELSFANMADVKELIPEFFFQPDFLRNVNHLDLGTKQDHTKLGDVVLPPWASTPEEFVRINREALESDHVSAHLHEWIDLIFGYKQKGKAAVDAANVFFYLTYAGSVDIDAIDNVALRKATEDQIANFGQTPMQLLTSPHPRRATAAERAKVSTGRISLPLRLPSSYTSQLVCNYQAPPRRKRTGGKEDKGDEERKVLLGAMPTLLCFTYHDVVITLTPSMGIQSHALSAFLQAPPTLLYPAHEHMQGIWQSERDAASSTVQPSSRSTSQSASREPSTSDSRTSDPSGSAVSAEKARELLRGVNRRGPGMVVDPSAPLSPSAAQFVPGSVVASHVLHPMCPHWFLSPVPLPSASASTTPTTSTSSSSQEQKSRALAPHSGRELYYAAVAAVAKNAKFLFTGGYFDGSIKCHALVHSKAHIEGEGGMGGGQQSQHVMAALAAKSDDPTNLQRPAVRTQNTLDIKPLSSVRQHSAVVTAMTLSLNQMVLVSGDDDGVVCIWRTYLDRQERTRPPIASSPLASFSVHEGRVLSVDTNTVIGIAVSLAQDVQRKRGCEVAVYSIRGGAARFMHAVVLHEPGHRPVPRGADRHRQPRGVRHQGQRAHAVAVLAQRLPPHQPAHPRRAVSADHHAQPQPHRQRQRRLRRHRRPPRAGGLPSPAQPRARADLLHRRPVPAHCAARPAAADGAAGTAHCGAGGRGRGWIGVCLRGRRGGWGGVAVASAATDFREQRGRLDDG